MSCVIKAFFAVLVVALFVKDVINGISTYLLTAVGQKIVARVREQMWLKLIFLPGSYYDETSSGETVSRVVNDTNIVKDLISEHFPQFVTGVISIIGAVTILLVMDWKMTLIMMLAVPITIAVLLPLGRRMAKISRGLQDETAVFTGNVQQTLSEIRLMKASNAEEIEKKNGIAGVDKLYQYGLREAKVMALI